MGCMLAIRQGRIILLGHASALLAPASGFEQVQVHRAGTSWAVLCSSCRLSKPLATKPKLSWHLHLKEPPRDWLALLPSRVPSRSHALCRAGAAAADQSLADHLQRFGGKLA